MLTLNFSWGPQPGEPILFMLFLSTKSNGLLFLNDILWRKRKIKNIKLCVGGHMVIFPFGFRPQGVKRSQEALLNLG